MLSDKEQYGYLTYALNTGDTDYESIAHLWALSVKLTHKHCPSLAVIVKDKQKCRSSLHTVFDHVIELPIRDVVNNMQYECDVLKLSPFKETVKFEADMLCTSDIMIWQKYFRLRDLCFTGHVCNFKQQQADDSKYRRYIKTNLLPNVYQGLYYVRTTRQTDKFMKTANSVFNNWDKEIKNLRMFDKFEPSTDFAFSIALDKLNMNNCVSNDVYPSFIHVKQGIVKQADWDQITWSLLKNKYFTVCGTQLSLPIHYFDKSFCTEKLIREYEYAVGI
tara:strand:+ start:427 stop:1254 length:828 start_codon:yes stop_codon:yes gene_type:complete